MSHPREWDGRLVEVRIFPYDNGFRESYVVCFERCDTAYADRSPFVIYTKPDRFKGFMGDQSVVVKARYSSTCFYKSALCPDLRFGRFREIE